MSGSFGVFATNETHFFKKAFCERHFLQNSTNETFLSPFVTNERHFFSWSHKRVNPKLECHKRVDPILKKSQTSGSQTWKVTNEWTLQWKVTNEWIHKWKVTNEKSDSHQLWYLYFPGVHARPSQGHRGHTCGVASAVRLHMTASLLWSFTYDRKCLMRNTRPNVTSVDPQKLV